VGRGRHVGHSNYKFSRFHLACARSAARRAPPTSDDRRYAQTMQAIHAAMAALGGGIGWRKTSEYVEALRNHGAPFVEPSDITKLLRSPLYQNFNEDFNDFGFYKKLYGCILLLQVRRAGDPPDLKYFGARANELAPKWGIGDSALSAALIQDLRACEPIASRVAAAAEKPARTLE
jgi:hypothetical protein